MVPSDIVLPKDRARLRCLVVAQHLSHYRTATYEELQRSVGWDFEFAGGRDSRDPGIPGLPDGALEKVSYLDEIWILGRALWQRGLLELCRSGRFDSLILEGNVAYLSTWCVLVWARFRGVRTYLWTIGWHRPERGLKATFRKAMYRLADKLLLYGEDAREYALSVGFQSDRVVVVGNSAGEVRPEQRAIALSRDSSERPSRNETVVGAVIRLRGLKRLDLLIHSVAELRARGIAIRVLLVGDGEAREELEALADQLGVPTEFRGAIYDPALLDDVYQELDLTVIPMHAGLSVIQSMSYGVPVVTVDDPRSQVPEFRAVRPGVTGGLYRAGDLNSLSEQIEAWIDRINANRSGVAKQCLDEVEDHWSAGAQGGRIITAITGSDWSSDQGRRGIFSGSRRSSGAK